MQSRLGYELGSPCPFPTTIPITPRVSSYLNQYKCMKILCMRKNSFDQYYLIYCYFTVDPVKLLLYEFENTVQVKQRETWIIAIGTQTVNARYVVDSRQLRIFKRSFSKDLRMSLATINRHKWPEISRIKIHYIRFAFNHLSFVWIDIVNIKFLFLLSTIYKQESTYLLLLFLLIFFF